GPYLFAGAEVAGGAPAAVAVARLEEDRQAQLLGRRPGALGVAGDPAVGDRDAGAAEQGARQLVVAGERLGQGAGAVGLGGEDAALAGAIAELEEPLVVEPLDRDLAPAGGAADGCHAGPGEG